MAAMLSTGAAHGYPPPVSWWPPTSGPCPETAASGAASISAVFEDEIPSATWTGERGPDCVVLAGHHPSRSNISGVPSSLQTRAELVKYLTMAIFTCSAQHAAFNNGQVDFFSWMLTSPCTMHQPPPKAKGTVTLENILESLPEVGTTSTAMITVRLQSSKPGDKRPLGTFLDEYFTEEEPKQCIKAFQERLSQISAEIESRNESLPVKYNFLHPKVIENSVSV